MEKHVKFFRQMEKKVEHTKSRFCSHSNSELNSWSSFMAAKLNGFDCNYFICRWRDAGPGANSGQLFGFECAPHGFETILERSHEIVVHFEVN